MTLDRKDYKSAIPQLESRLAKIEKIGKDAFNKFEDIAHKTQLDAAEAEKKVLSLDYKMTTTRVQMEYQLCTTGQDPTEANWQTSMPSITYGSYQGKTLWYRSKTYVNDIVVQTTPPMTVNLMDGVYAFVNTVSGNTGWTTIDGDTIQTGKITSHDGNCYFDIDNNNFQMKDNSTLASSTNALAWDNGQLYIKGKIAIGNTTTDKKYYTEMTGGGFDIVANNVNLAHIGYASGDSGSSTPATAPYYTFGKRKSDTSSTRGNYSVAEGYNTTASGFGSHAEGGDSEAQGTDSHAEGNHTLARGLASHAGGLYTITNGTSRTAIGSYNVDDRQVDTFIGDGITSDFTVTKNIGTRGDGFPEIHVEINGGSTPTGPISVNGRVVTLDEPVPASGAVIEISYPTTSHALVIGNGSGNSNRSNAWAVDWNGKMYTNQIQGGTIASEAVSSGGIRTVTVTFPQAMSGTPAVIACLQSSSEYAETGSVSVGVSSISSTGFTCKVFNNSSRALSPAVKWLAINGGLP